MLLFTVSLIIMTLFSRSENWLYNKKSSVAFQGAAIPTAGLVTSKCSFLSPTPTEDRMLLADSFMSTQILYFKQRIPNLAVRKDLYPPIKRKEKRKIHVSINLFVFLLAIQRGGSAWGFTSWLPGKITGHAGERVNSWHGLYCSNFIAPSMFSFYWSWYISYRIILSVLFLAPLLGNLILRFVLLILIYNLPSDCFR